MTEDTQTDQDEAISPRATTSTVMTVDDLSAYLQVSKKVVYALAKSGDVPVTKVAGEWRFFKPLIDRWLMVKSLRGYDGPDLGADRGLIP
jgi:excisionase family DNA binding protein